MKSVHRFCFVAMVCASSLLNASLPAADVSTQPKSAHTSGQKAPSFEMKTTDGKTIKFPEDYKGKVVLLDFWATWCPPCRAEMPNVVAVYDRYRDQGFDVVGISLDRENSAGSLTKFTTERKMRWPQIYDGKYWQAAVAEQYGIRSIPRPILVDGDTGMILAEGWGARGSRLGRVIEKGLAAKKRAATRGTEKEG